MSHHKCKSKDVMVYSSLCPETDYLFLDCFSKSDIDLDQSNPKSTKVSCRYVLI